MKHYVIFSGWLSEGAVTCGGMRVEHLDAADMEDAVAKARARHGGPFADDDVVVAEATDARIVHGCEGGITIALSSFASKEPAIEWKPCREGGLGAELKHGSFTAYLWAWDDVRGGAVAFCARVLVVDGEDEPFDRTDYSAENLDDAKQKAVDLLRLYLDGDPEERAFKEKLRAWVTP